MEFKAGFVEDEYYDAEALQTIASIPSRDGLIAKFLGSTAKGGFLMEIIYLKTKYIYKLLNQKRDMSEQFMNSIQGYWALVFVISVCRSMFVMSAAAFLMPVSSAGDAVPRPEFHFCTVHGFAFQSTFQWSAPHGPPRSNRVGGRGASIRYGLPDHA